MADTTNKLVWEFTKPIETREDWKERNQSLKDFIEANYRDKNRKTREFTVTYLDEEYEKPEDRERRTATRTAKLRLFVSDCNDVCYFKKGSSRRGYYAEGNSYQTIVNERVYVSSKIIKLEFSEGKGKTPEQEFKDNCDKVLKHLAVDGLWTNIRKEVEFIKLFPLDKIKEFYDVRYGCYRECKTVEDMEAKLQRQEKDYEYIYSVVMEKGSEEIKQFFAENTKLVIVNDEFISHFYSHEKELIEHFRGRRFQTCYSPFDVYQYINGLKIKKMIFHKSKWQNYITAEKLKQIAYAMDNKEKFHTSGRNGYDVSFEYNPELNRAWYSEEYSGCGNGHYYLALNRTHAMYCEDD